eukprot:CAMPEP_0113847524 /NCGR_PEP_ID=MMETSP0372-20130328/1923_1 /TAXON_ID=340204 /ORGANISM="Lankesteria abbotti" /LENGTH=233 /DNA_ID=CAMNT_0000816813 /DNA_START=42 /DNA_END=743 /DNA_ORIENTATION=+ /assembly_acc=CAM_ASM_000359
MAVVAHSANLQHPLPVHRVAGPQVVSTGSHVLPAGSTLPPTFTTTTVPGGYSVSPATYSLSYPSTAPITTTIPAVHKSPMQYVNASQPIVSAPASYRAPGTIHTLAPHSVPSMTTGYHHPVSTTVTHQPHIASHAHHSPADYGTYRPAGAEYVHPGTALSGGMTPTYDRNVVPTFEGGLVIQAENPPVQRQYEARSRGVASSVGGGSFTETHSKSPRMPRRSVKPEKKAGWCC